MRFLQNNRKVVEDSIRNSQEFYQRRGVDLKLNEIYDKAKSFSETAKDKFETGKIYPDASGNRARYLGNGQWQELPKGN